jgi:phage shock protein A
MSWISIFRRANSYAQAKADAEFDSRADPKVQVEQAMAGLRQHHLDLQAAASRVLAQEKLAAGRLADLSDQETKYTRSALAAKQQGNVEVARTFALKVASLREQRQALTAELPQLQQAAADAREAVQESAEQLQQKFNERSAILAQVDRANMQREMAASLQQVSDLTRSANVPSFDEIQQKVAAQLAQAQATTELSSTSPEVLEMHAHHAELTSEADDILAELEAGPAQPQLQAGQAPLALSTHPAESTAETASS